MIHFSEMWCPDILEATKQSVTVTSTNHAELLASHEAAREVVWLRTVERILDQQCELRIAD